MLMKIVNLKHEHLFFNIRIELNVENKTNDGKCALHECDAHGWCSHKIKLEIVVQDNSKGSSLTLIFI